jgi:hypothetical protein
LSLKIKSIIVLDLKEPLACHTARFENTLKKTVYYKNHLLPARKYCGSFPAVTGCI